MAYTGPIPGLTLVVRQQLGQTPRRRQLTALDSTGHTDGRPMRKYLDIHLKDRKIDSRELSGREHAEAGRYFIAKTLLDMVAKVDIAGSENPLIFSAGLFRAQTSRTPTGRVWGVKAHSRGASKKLTRAARSLWRSANRKSQALRCTASPTIGSLSTCQRNEIRFDDATPYMGRDNIETAAMLHEPGKDQSRHMLPGR